MYSNFVSIFLAYSTNKHTRIINSSKIVSSLKVHEDIICIDTENSSQKLEKHILIPIIHSILKEFISHKLLSSLKDICKNCEL